jgi:transcriptional regulator with XRE-family HTH domain
MADRMPVKVQKGKSDSTDRIFRQIGKRLRDIRLSQNMVQEDLMEFGFTTRHYQRIEAGAPITIRTAVRLCKAFKIKLSELFSGL